MVRPLMDFYGKQYGKYMVWRTYDDVLGLTFMLDGMPDRQQFIERNSGTS